MAQTLQISCIFELDTAVHFLPTSIFYVSDVEHTLAKSLSFIKMCVRMCVWRGGGAGVAYFLVTGLQMG